MRKCYIILYNIACYIMILCMICTIICACMQESIIASVIGLISICLAMACFYYVDLTTYRMEHMLHKKPYKIK